MAKLREKLLIGAREMVSSLGKQIEKDYGMSNGLEVTNDVFESEANVAFEQAENRMHTARAALWFLLTRSST